MADLEALLMEELICPTCPEYMFPPIQQCATGHTYCETCFNTLKICPACRAPKTKSRCFVLEKIHGELTFNCKYAIDGCSHKAKGHIIKAHEEVCKFSGKACPFRLYECPWRGKKDDIFKHCISDHPRNVFTATSQTLSCSNFKGLTDEPFSAVILRAYGELFHCAWKRECPSGIMKWCVYFIGVSRNHNNYSYEIVFQGPSDEDKSTYSMVANCEILNHESEMFSDKNCTLTHSDMISKFCDADDDLIYTIKIINNSLPRNVRK